MCCAVLDTLGFGKFDDTILQQNGLLYFSRLPGESVLYSPTLSYNIGSLMVDFRPQICVRLLSHYVVTLNLTSAPGVRNIFD